MRIVDVNPDEFKKYEYRVSYKREGSRKVHRIFITKETALRWVKWLKEHSEGMWEDYQYIYNEIIWGPTFQVREVGEWEDR